MFLHQHHVKAKPVVRQGRKATGLWETAGLPWKQGEKTHMKHLIKSITVTMVLILLAAGPASATKFDFTGDWFLSSTTMTFSGNFISQSTFVPAGDGIFSDPGIEYVEIAPFTGSKVGGDFIVSPTMHTDGFKLFDDGGALLFDADLEVTMVEGLGAIGFVNPYLGMNLTNIAAGGGYVAGSSSIVDAFLAAPGGGMVLTMNLFDSIEGSGTYSGSAVPAPVPEPAPLLLLGFGLIGVARLMRKKFYS